VLQKTCQYNIYLTLTVLIFCFFYWFSQFCRCWEEDEVANKVDKQVHITVLLREIQKYRFVNKITAKQTTFKIVSCDKNDLFRSRTQCIGMAFAIMTWHLQILRVAPGRPKDDFRHRNRRLSKNIFKLSSNACRLAVRQRGYWGVTTV